MPVILRVQGFKFGFYSANSSEPPHVHVIPLVIPLLSEVRAFAEHLHALGADWHGEILGWEAEYTPESPEQPLDSNMQFTPATFLLAQVAFGFIP